MMPTIAQTFQDAYLECAFWSESLGDEVAAFLSTEHDADYAPDSSPQDAGFAARDLTKTSRRAVARDCMAFLAEPAMIDYLAAGHDAGQAGHDFWLTRNGHGAGFWDRGLGQLGDRLTDACKPYGSAYLYVYADGSVEYAADSESQ